MRTCFLESRKLESWGIEDSRKQAREGGRLTGFFLCRLASFVSITVRKQAAVQNKHSWLRPNTHSPQSHCEIFVFIFYLSSLFHKLESTYCLNLHQCRCDTFRGLLHIWHKMSARTQVRSDPSLERCAERSAVYTAYLQARGSKPWHKWWNVVTKCHDVPQWFALGKNIRIDLDPALVGWG